MLQSTGLQKVIHDLVTEQQSKFITENSPQKRKRNGLGGGGGR